MENACTDILRVLTDRKHIVFVSRGNSAILSVLKLVKHLGYTDVLMQDQGGWITYPQFIEKLKLTEIRLKTNHGFIDVADLKNHKKSVLLINSMPGYFALQSMNPVFEECKKNNVLLINDVAGSIGTEEAKIGDVIIGSFGKWKPLNVEEGGFLATDNDEHYKFLKDFEVEIDFAKLLIKLENLKDKLAFFIDHNKKIKADLSDYNIVHKKEHGFNVVVKYSSDQEKENLIKYCQQNGYEFVECPKYIRILEDAISIEVKRLDN
ncbi:MAG: DegT/DnrJ/EryC1/StrS family aminotransferase [archaeon]